MRPGISSQAVFIWISIGCTVVVCLSMGALALTHMMNYTIPREQRLLLRIIFLPPIFTVCNLISTIFYPSAVYLNQFPKIVEAIGLAAVFELYVFYLTPGATPDQRDYYFETLDRKHVKVPLFCCFSKRHTKTKHDRGSLRWFKVRSQTMVSSVSCPFPPTRVFNYQKIEWANFSIVSNRRYRGHSYSKRS